MAATATRPPAARAFGEFRGAARDGLGDTPPGAAALAAGLAIAVLYAMFASGAIDIPEETRLQVGIALLSLATLAGVLFGRGLRVTGVPGAGLGVALLAGFAAWSALSMAWSISPDQSWLWANRAIAYTLVVLLALALGSSLPRAQERVAAGFLGIATLVSLWALAGKVAPWIEVPGIFDLNTAEQFSRLRSPLDYWNALGMVMVLGIPIALRGATAWEWSDRLRFASMATFVPLFVTLLLTYSRGGLIALAVAVAILVWAGPDRLALVVTLVGGLLASVPAAVFGLTSNALTKDNVPVDERVPEGLILGALLVVGVLVAIRIAAWVALNRDQLVLTDQGRAAVKRGALIAAAAAVLILLIGAGTSSRGLSGSISHQWDEFTTAKEDKQTDPGRVLQASSGNRWVWWQEAAGAFSDRPLVGHGAGSFPLLHRQYRQNLIQVKQPHNTPLEFLSETGLVGAFLALGGLLMLGLAGVRAMLARPPNLERGFAAAMLAGLAAFALHMCIDWDWDIPGVMLPVMIFLGVTAARPQFGSEPPVGGGTTSARAVALALGCVAAALIAVSAALPSYSATLTSDALSEASTNDPGKLQDAARKVALAKRLNPFSIQPLLAQASILERGNQGAAAYDALVDAVKLQPSNGAAWLRLSRLEFLLAKPGAATSSALVALRLDPASIAGGGSYLVQLARADPARSASVAGTPLPVRIITVPLLPTPALPGGAAPQGGATPPPGGATPTPTPTPTPPAGGGGGGGGGGNNGGGGGGGGGGEPFRLEG